MAANGSGRSGLLTAGGVLSIVAGALQVIGAAIMIIAHGLILLNPWYPGDWWRLIMPVIPFELIMFGLIVLGIVAIIGGVSALRRSGFGLSLAGAICALPLTPLGILAVIFVSLSKGEFEAKESAATE